MSEPSKKNFETLQLLRGIAAMLVVFYHGTHADFLMVFKFGYMGVDLFFVLSGFVISYIHFTDFGVKHKLKPYLQKRMIRVYPLYVIVTLLYVLMVTIYGHPILLDYFVKSILLLPQEKDPIVGVAWTLQHELLFYILFSLCIWKKKLFFPLITLWGSFITLFMLFKDILPTSPTLDLIFSPINLEFLFGCVIALIIIKKKMNSLNWVTTLGISTLMMSLLLNMFGILNIHRVISWGIPSSIIIWGLVKFEQNNKLKIPRILVTLGDSSYSIYLTHLLSLIVLEAISKRVEVLTLFNKTLAEIFVCIIAIAVGYIFHLIIEIPLQNFLRNRISAQRKIILGTRYESESVSNVVEK